MSRSLAHVEEIKALHPIENKDRIVLAEVLGWTVIVQKSEFNVGDKVVYVEIDSVLPEKPEFEFLRSKNFRIKTMKMAGCLSQGICFPLSILPEKSNGEYEVGEDVTDVIGITQYEPDMDDDKGVIQKEIKPTKRYPKFLMRMGWFRKLVLPKKQAKGFPDFISKTDETRVENVPHYLLDKKQVVLSEKIDGCITGNMLIQTDIGEIKISNIVNQRMDVKVLSYDEETGVNVFNNILDYHKIKVYRPMYSIGVGFRGKGNREKHIKCTDNHKFYTPNGWIEAKDIKVGDTVYHYSKRFPYEIKQLIYGSLLGDASINSNSPNGNYRCVHFSQSDKQKEYFNYKKKILGKYGIGECTRISGYGSLMHVIQTTTNLDLLNFINKNCIRDGKKTVTKEWLDAIDPLGLAFWYMDDGTLINREKDNLQCRIQFATNGFSYDEHILLQEMLHNKFGIESTIGDKETYKGYNLILDIQNTERFCSLIAPYVCSSMKYKLPKKYENIPCVYENNCEFNEELSISETKVLSKELLNDKIGYVFDLTIENNSNYFAHNILLHNCSETVFLKRIPKKHFWQKDKFDFGVCSRNLRIWNEDESSYWSVARRYNIKQVLEELIGDNDFVAIQGECIGTGIQKNRYHINGYDLYVFNLIYPTGRLGSLEAKKIVEKHGLKFVPIINDSYTLPDTIEELRAYAHGQSALYPTLREGLVIRSLDGVKSFKCVDPEFLLKNNE